MPKRCSKCKNTKDNLEFYYRSDKPHLLQSRCKLCILEDRKIFRLNNLEKERLQDRIYGQKNRDKRIIYLKKYNKINSHRKIAIARKRYNTEVWFRLRSLLKNRLRMALLRNNKSGSTIKLLGCSINDFRKYLENKFYNGMSWKDLLQGKIHIDHKIPCSKFDLSKSEEQKKCFHYTNLQPLWAKDNLAKKDKLNWEVCYL